MHLILVESPVKSKTLQGFLGPKYRVLASYGHIRDLPKDELGIDIENDFKPKYIIPEKSKKIVQGLIENAQKAQIVILGTDQDREGESIAWHIVQALGLDKIKNEKFHPHTKICYGGKQIKNYQRIVFHEITKRAIEEALKNPRKIDMNLVDAQQARRVLDRIVGYKLSPFLWKKIARRLSAGRVQSATVRLVVDKEREIENFIPQEYWLIKALLQSRRTRQNKTLDHAEKEFSALLVKKNGETISKLGITTKKEADEIVKDLKGAEYRVQDIEKKETKRNPLPPFTTSTLQQEAWKKFHFPAKFTMRVAQQLYERGLTSYHRTDSLNLSNLSLFAAKKFIIGNYGKEYWAGFLRKYKTKTKGAQEAHEAIRPTFAEKTPEKLKIQKELDENQFRLYDLIWRRFIACQMSQAVFDSTVVEIEAGNPKSEIRNPKQILNSKFQNSKYTFRATGQVLKFDGFLKIYPVKFEENELPSLEKDEVLKLLKLIPSQHFTQPPSRYTEATLIKALEENGIGRPSTYAPVISTIQERNYIEKDENRKFRPTEIGTVVNSLLVKHFPEIVDIKFTAEMEEGLDKIAQGQKKWVQVLKEFYTPFEKNLSEKYQEVSKKEFTEKPTEKICPKCGAPIIIRLGKFGKFYACSGFPKCRYTEPLEKNTLGIKCPKCKTGEILEKRTKRGKIFYGCSNWPKCDFALWEKPLPGRQAGTGEICPKCSSLLVETKRKQIKCSNRDCDYKK